MEVNIGAQDKKIRIGAGVLLLILGIFVFKGNILLIILGFVALITGLLNYSNTEPPDYYFSDEEWIYKTG